MAPSTAYVGQYKVPGTDNEVHYMAPSTDYVGQYMAYFTTFMGQYVIPSTDYVGQYEAPPLAEIFPSIQFLFLATSEYTPGSPPPHPNPQLTTPAR